MPALQIKVNQTVASRTCTFNPGMIEFSRREYISFPATDIVAAAQGHTGPVETASVVQITGSFVKPGLWDSVSCVLEFPFTSDHADAFAEAVQLIDSCKADFKNPKRITAAIHPNIEVGYDCFPGPGGLCALLLITHPDYGVATFRSGPDQLKAISGLATFVYIESLINPDAGPSNLNVLPILPP